MSRAVDCLASADVAAVSAIGGSPIGSTSTPGSSRDPSFGVVYEGRAAAESFVKLFKITKSAGTRWSLPNFSTSPTLISQDLIFISSTTMFGTSPRSAPSRVASSSSIAAR